VKETMFSHSGTIPAGNRWTGRHLVTAQTTLCIVLCRQNHFQNQNTTVVLQWEGSFKW